MACSIIEGIRDLGFGAGARDSGSGPEEPESQIPNPESPELPPLRRLVNRAPAAADRGADERAFLATEDRADARAGRRRSADDERGLLPVTSRRALDARHRT